MSWYRQYRPTTISGLHLQSVRDQLEKLRTAKSFPHALLLTGPRGAGKTSTARIIAAMLNDPANAAGAPLKDANPKDELVQRIILGGSMAVNEMDAASHRGIDDVRALKEQAYLPPQEGNTLVFILDEVHMLTTEAFNALLKLLEEPPSHVVFILATTEEHKVPETIISRSTMIRFHKASNEELKSALAPIVKDQKLKIEDDALTAIAASADGSFRDAVKLLETVAAGVDNITMDHVQKHLRSTPVQTIFQLIDAIVAKNDLDVVGVFNALRNQNADQKQFLSGFLNALHEDLMTAVSQPDKSKYSKRISQYLLGQFSGAEVAYAGPIPFMSIELKALEIVFKAQDQSSKPSAPNSGSSASGQGGQGRPVVTSIRKTAVTSTSSSAPAATFPTTSTLVASEMADGPVMPDFSDAPASASSSTIDRVVTATQDAPSYTSVSTDRAGDPALSMMLIEKWMEFITAVEQRNGSLAALLRSAKASLTAGGNVCVEVYYQFHRDQLRQPKFLRILEDACGSLIGQSTCFEFQLAGSSKVAESLSTVSIPVGESEQMIQLAQEVFL